MAVTSGPDSLLVCTTGLIDELQAMLTNKMFDSGSCAGLLSQLMYANVLMLPTNECVKKYCILPTMTVLSGKFILVYDEQIQSVSVCLLLRITFRP